MQHCIPLCKKMCKLVPMHLCTLSVKQSKLEHEGIKSVHFMFQQNPIQTIIFSLSLCPAGSKHTLLKYLDLSICHVAFLYTQFMKGILFHSP